MIGQIWIKKGSYASFVEVTHLYPDGQNETRVGYKKILENRDESTIVILLSHFLNEFAFAFDLYDLLQEKFLRQPRAKNPENVALHQIWRKDDMFIRVVQVGFESSPNFNYVPVSKLISRRINLAKAELPRHFEYVTNLIDILKIVREEISFYQKEKSPITLG